jgi:hypothetical protein
MQHDEPASLKLTIAAFRAIREAVTEAEIGGELADVTISELRPELQMLAGALAVEVRHAATKRGQGGGLTTWIVGGDGRVIARMDDPHESSQQE